MPATITHLQPLPSAPFPWSSARRSGKSGRRGSTNQSFITSSTPGVRDIVTRDAKKHCAERGRVFGCANRATSCADFARAPKE